MDDVGASSKRYEIYSKALPLPGPAGSVGDVLFLKALPPFRAWGPYRELSDAEWGSILDVLRHERSRLTAAITATWVTWNGDLIPFPERFPHQAAIIRRGVDEGLLEVANHGLTHCVLTGRAFRPRWFTGNRRAHREFWPWLPHEVHLEHLERAQRILEDWIGRPIASFVPPGNVFSATTLVAAEAVGLRVVSCRTTPRESGLIKIVGDEHVRAFHDRDIVLGGVESLRRIIAEQRSRGMAMCFVRDLGSTG